MTTGSNVFVGIDPGKEGAAVAWFANTREIEVYDKLTEDTNDFFAWLVSICPDHIFIEKAQAMPKNGAVAMFNYGKGYGELVACLELSEAPWTAIAPAMWTRIMHIGCVGEKPKIKSAQAFKRLIPELTDASVLDAFSKKKQEGIIDATLICLFGYRHILGKRSE